MGGEEWKLQMELKYAFSSFYDTVHMYVTPTYCVVGKKPFSLSS